LSTGTPAVGSPALTQVHVLVATGLATGAPVVAVAVLTQVHDLTATGLETGGPALGTPALTSGTTGSGIPALIVIRII